MFKIFKASAYLVLATSLVGCGTTFGDFQKGVEKYPENRFCVMAIEPVVGGLTDDAVTRGRVSGYNWCANDSSLAIKEALNACNQRVGKQCVVAYLYDRQNNRYVSNQSANVRDYRNAIKESKMQKCDAYGFQRGTTPFAQCLQQVEQQESIDAANAMQANELNRQAQERQWRKTQCYASGRLDC